MWYEDKKYPKIVTDVNLELAKLKGELEDDVAKVTLAKFLFRNLGFTTELLTGLKLAPFQIINIKGMMQSNNSLCVWGRGVSKCLEYSESQLLLSDEGVSPITKLLAPDFSKEEHWENIPTLRLWNGHGYAETNKILVQPKKSCVKLTTKRGYYLSGSTVHKIKVIDQESCSIAWKTYDQLNVGDYVCIDRGQPEWNGGKSAEDIDEAYLVGLLVGDGCFVSNVIKLTSADKEIIDFATRFTSKPVRLDPRTKGTYDVKFEDDVNIGLRGKYELGHNKSYFKKIPSLIFSSKELLKAFLQGLFDTDAGVERGGDYVSYCSTSSALAHQVHTALLTFGVVSSLKERKTDSPFGKAFIITISGGDARKFYANVGFRLSRKMGKRPSVSEKKANANLDVVPGVIQYANKVKSKYKWSVPLNDEWHDKIQKRTNQQSTSYETTKRYVDFFKKAGVYSRDYENIENICQENFFFDKIESLELFQGNCIDFNIPDGEMYWSNGFISHNTFSAAMYCILQTIFQPKTNILIAGPTFRTARFIFNHIEKITARDDAQMLLAAMGAKSKRNDEFRWSINGGEIGAIPLNGEKIRGFRANILVIDEFLLMSEEIVEKVLRPFLTVPQDLEERLKIRFREDELIRRGAMKESDRIVFSNDNKLIALSSASYTCEYLYRKYDEYIKNICSPNLSKESVSFFVSQLAWNAIPEDMIDKSVIETAKSDEANSAMFTREYCARFIDGSDSYFSMKKMLACSIPDGNDPTLLLRGKKGSKYILSIDPNFSNSATADHFAMCVIEIDEEGTGGTIVHQYARAGKDLKDHIQYFFYILTNFNVVMILSDHAGYQFIEAANENELFRKARLEIKVFEFSAEKDGAELEAQLQNARRNYNVEAQKIAFTQVFTVDFIRKANEHLQNCIDCKKIWFGSLIKANPSAFSIAESCKVNVTELGEESVLDFIDTQEALIRQTRYECASIEVKTTVKGTQSFDLPQMMKRDTSADRMRRDSYTALLLGTWALKCYHDIKNVPAENSGTFSPFFV